MIQNNRNGNKTNNNLQRRAVNSNTAQKKKKNPIDLRAIFLRKKHNVSGVKKKSLAGKIFSSVLSVILTILLICFITGSIVVGVFAIYIKNYIDPVIDDFDLMSTGQKLSSKIYYMDYTDREGRVGEPVEIDNQRLYGSENRVWVSFNEMPSYLYEAFISIEDERFWTHNGVDWKRTLGATFYFFTGSPNYGGSTIPQQLIKNITGEKDVRIQRKLQEIMRALYLSNTKDKTEILELYLNTIYLSQGCYGVQAAANTYFGKDVSELTLVECAAIASITQAPTKWDPIQNPENNEFRRKTVLDKMYELGKITYSEYEEARNADLVLNVNSGSSVEGDDVDTDEEYNSWYTDAVINSVVDRLVEEKNIPENLAFNMLYSGGLRIYTVMDPEIQETLERVYEENGSVFQKLPGVIQPESSMVIIHPTTGDVLGLVGGRGKKQGNLILNCATGTKRSPGSSIKPLSVYAPALEAGIINYASVYDDVPVNYDYGKYTYDKEEDIISYLYKETGQRVDRSGGWPANLPEKYEGLNNINYAIQVSKNTVAVRVLQDLTCEASFDFLKNKLHMNSMIERLQLSNGEWVTDKGLAALALGEMNYGVTNLEITAAYSIFTNKGVYNQPRLFTQVLDSEGNVVLGDNCEYSLVISEQNATIMTKMLQNVVEKGTAKEVTLRSEVDVAGKTGTTNSDHDRWFVGYTPYVIGGVWYGYLEPDSLSKAQGNPAAKIWNEVMTQVHQIYFERDAKAGANKKTFEDARDIVTVTVCKDSGKLMSDACKADPRGSRAEVAYFTADTVPVDYCDVHVMVKYDKVTKAVACNGCPDNNIIEVGLLNITSRNFPKQLTVTDAQYTCRYIDSSIAPSSWSGDAYYVTGLPEGIYAGRSSGNNQFNHACYQHYKAPERISDVQSVSKIAILPPSIKIENDGHGEE